MTSRTDDAALAETIADLSAKLDRLSAQVEFLTEEALAQRERRQERRELTDDLVPVAREAYLYAVDQLAQVEQYATIDDVTHLVKKLIRNTKNLEDMLDRLESLQQLVDEVTPLTQDASIALMEALADLERRGYFGFIRSGAKVIDNVVANFTEADVEALGDNVVMILQAIREMTQPEIMTMVRNTAQTVRTVEIPEKLSWRQLIRQMRDPAVKKGLARFMLTMRSVAGVEDEE